MILLLAPMEGLLDFVLRDVLTRVGGVDRCVSEFIRITGTLLPDKVFLRYVPELRNGSRAQDIGQARARVQAAQVALRKAQQDVDRRQPLVDPGAISRDLWQATVAQRDQAQAALNEAQQALSKLDIGARPEQIEAAEAALRGAQAARGTLAVDRGDTALRSATAGTVVTRAQEPGAIVQPGATVLTLSIDRPLRVRAYVAESALSRVEPAQGRQHAAHHEREGQQGVRGGDEPRRTQPAQRRATENQYIAQAECHRARAQRQHHQGVEQHATQPTGSPALLATV